jgi:hypothetical protein
MPPRHDLPVAQTYSTAKPSTRKPVSQDPMLLMLQRALAKPTSQNLTLPMLQTLHQTYGSAFVQCLRDRAAQPTPALMPQSQSLDAFLGEIQSARAAHSTGAIQAKLTVTPAGDQYEQEADTVSKQVVQQMNAPTPAAQRQENESDHTVQREHPEDAETIRRVPDRSPQASDDINPDGKNPRAQIQRQSNDLLGGLDVTPDVETRIQSARGSGAAIAGEARTKLEGAFGADFSGVRVHTDSESDVLNRSVQARAFTTGQDIFFRQGEYNPASSGGQELLAHELTHVVQQSPATVQRKKTESRPSPLRTYANAAGLRVQRVAHNRNFEHYIRAYLANTGTPLPVLGAAPAPILAFPTWLPALQAARLLDFTGNRGVGQALTVAPGGHVAEMDAIRAFVVAASGGAGAGAGVHPGGQHNSVINWGPLQNGFGTFVEAQLLPGTQAVGSSPTMATTEWQELHHRKQANGNTLYARGHLLHDEMGGPGLDYNIVPLTATIGGDYGANHANWAHRYTVEGMALGAYRNMVNGPQTVTRVDYQVYARARNAARPQTPLVQAIYQGYQIERLAKSLALGGEPTNLQVTTPPGPGVAGGLANRVGTFNGGAVPHIADGLSAVGADPALNPNEAANTVLARLQQNALLWQREDVLVPEYMRVRVRYVLNGILQGWQSTPVDVFLPTSLAAPYV